MHAKHEGQNFVLATDGESLMSAMTSGPGAVSSEHYLGIEIDDALLKTEGTKSWTRPNPQGWLTNVAKRSERLTASGKRSICQTGHWLRVNSLHRKILAKQDQVAQLQSVRLFAQLLNVSF